MAKDDEKVSLTREQLQQLIAEGVKAQQMDPQEKRLRTLIGEVFDERLDAYFESAVPGRNAPDPGADPNAGDGDKPKGLFDQLADFLSPADAT